MAQRKKVVFNALCTTATALVPGLLHGSEAKLSPAASVTWWATSHLPWPHLPWPWPPYRATIEDHRPSSLKAWCSHHTSSPDSNPGVSTCAKCYSCSMLTASPKPAHVQKWVSSYTRAHSDWNPAQKLYMDWPRPGCRSNGLARLCMHEWASSFSIHYLCTTTVQDLCSYGESYATSFFCWALPLVNAIFHGY